MIERVTVVKFIMNDVSGSGAGCFGMGGYSKFHGCDSSKI